MKVWYFVKYSMDEWMDSYRSSRDMESESEAIYYFYCRVEDGYDNVNLCSYSEDDYDVEILASRGAHI